MLRLCKFQFKIQMGRHQLTGGKPLQQSGKGDPALHTTPRVPVMRTDCAEMAKLKATVANAKRRLHEMQKEASQLKHIINGAKGELQGAQPVGGLHALQNAHDLLARLGRQMPNMLVLVLHIMGVCNWRKPAQDRTVSVTTMSDTTASRVALIVSMCQKVVHPHSIPDMTEMLSAATLAHTTPYPVQQHLQKLGLTCDTRTLYKHLGHQVARMAMPVGGMVVFDNFFKFWNVLFQRVQKHAGKDEGIASIHVQRTGIYDYMRQEPNRTVYPCTQNNYFFI